MLCEENPTFRLVPSRNKSEGEVFPVANESGWPYLNAKAQGQREAITRQN